MYAKVDDVSYNAIVKMATGLYPNCNNLTSWDSANAKRYQECTNQIGNSYSLSIGEIEFFYIHRNEKMPSVHMEFQKILEEFDLSPKAPNEMEHAIAYIKNVSTTTTTSSMV